MRFRLGAENSARTSNSEGFIHVISRDLWLNQEVPICSSLILAIAVINNCWTLPCRKKPYLRDAGRAPLVIIRSRRLTAEWASVATAPLPAIAMGAPE